MRYSCNLIIDLPRARVIALFDDAENLHKWQDGLVSFTHRSGAAGQPGAISDIVYRMGKREVHMVETITRRDLPDVFSATFEADGVWNEVINTFEDTAGGKTAWRIDTEFRCSGLIRILAFVMPGMFRRQTERMMRDFKTYAEAAG